MQVHRRVKEMACSLYSSQMMYGFRRILFFNTWKINDDVDSA